MNDTRRRLLADAKQKIEEGMALIEQAQSEEQDYYDNMPQSFQDGEKGSTVQETIDNLEMWRDEIGQATDQLDEIINGVSPTPAPRKLTPGEDYSKAYVTHSSVQGWIITGIETPIFYSDGIKMEPAMVGPFASCGEAEAALNQLR